jgi:hypothetical protein
MSNVTEIDININININIDIADFLDENGKVSFKPINYNNHYLPPITGVMSDLGFKANFTNFVEYTSNEFDKPINLSSSSIRNISSKGISAKYGQKLLTWFKEIASTSIDTAGIKKAATLKSLRIALTRSTSSEWYPFIQGLELSMKKDDLSDLYKPLFDFLKSRSEFESYHFRSGKRAIKSKKLDPDDFKSIWKHHMEIWVEHSQVPKDQLDLFTSFIGDSRSTSEIGAKDETLAILPMMYLTYDFYLEFIAHYEVSFLMYMNAYVKKVPDLKSKKWILTKAIENYVSPLEAANNEASSSDSHNTHSPRTLFGSILKVLKDEMGELKSNENQGSNDGWHKLASFIEIETKDSLEPLAQRQYDQLKQWRKGKDTPSFKSLNAFISNYLKYVGKSGNEEIEMFFRIMLMLDRLESRTLATVKDKPAAKGHIKTVLAQYSSYYHACLNQELAKQK